MNRTQIYFPKSRIDELHKVARLRNVTLSEVIRELVEKGLQVEKPIEKKPRKFKSILETAREIQRMGFKGPKDLAQNLDKYLYGDM